jgi:hypothetical protein
LRQEYAFELGKVSLLNRFLAVENFIVYTSWELGDHKAIAVQSVLMLGIADIFDREHALLARYIADRGTVLRDVSHSVRLFRHIARELLQVIDLGGDTHVRCDDAGSITCWSSVEVG